LESAQAKGVDTVEQPIQAQQSQSVLNESEPSSKATAPQPPSHKTEPQPEPEPAASAEPKNASLVVQMNYYWIAVALMAGLLYN
jgi:hypothetical protein